MKIISNFFLIEGTDIYQLRSIPWKNIVPCKSYFWSRSALKIKLENLFSTVFKESP